MSLRVHHQVTNIFDGNFNSLAHEIIPSSRFWYLILRTSPPLPYSLSLSSYLRILLSCMVNHSTQCVMYYHIYGQILKP